MITYNQYEEQKGSLRRINRGAVKKKIDYIRLFRTL